MMSIFVEWETLLMSMSLVPDALYESDYLGIDDVLRP